MAQRKRPTRGADPSDLQSLLPPSLLPETSPTPIPPLLAVGVLASVSFCIFFFNACLYYGALVFFPCLPIAFHWDFQLLEVRDRIVFCVSSRHSVHVYWYLGGRKKEPGALVLSQSGTGLESHKRDWVISHQRRLEGACFLLTDRNFRELGSFAQVHSFSKLTKCVWSTCLVQGGLQSLVLRTAG